MKRLLICITLVLSSCGSNREIRAALHLAGENRAELQKVLDHYKNDPQKLRAAEFLIANMPGHYSYIPDKIVDFKRDYERIMATDSLTIPEKQRMLEELSKKHDLNNCIDEDVRILSADFLIQDIDRSFEIWENEPYCQHLTFEQFCELILPYKVLELQEQDNWKTELAGVYNKMYRVIPDDAWDNTLRTARRLSDELFSTNKVNHVHNYKGYRLYNKNTLKNVRFGTCDAYSISAIAIMRSKGIPACFERLPQWAKKSTGHSWHTILNDNGTYTPSPWNLESLLGDVFFPDARMPKVFRNTYAANPFYAEYFRKSKLKLPKFSKFQEDVTDLYIGTKDLAIPVRTRGIKERYAYLCVFNNTEWSPIDVGATKGGKAIFNNVGLGIAYLIMGFNGEGLVPISDPFIIHTTSEIEFLTPDMKNTLDGVKLTRKFPRSPAVALTEEYVIGGQIHAANKPDFSDADTLYIIENHDYPDLIKVSTDKPYRYIRYSQFGYQQHCSLAELQVFGAGTVAEPLKGEIIASEKDLERGLPAISAIFDGDWLTAYTSRVWGGWVGVDLSHPTSLAHVRVVPRSNDNSVRYGDTYELKYWSDEGWVSLGEQVAHERFVVYDHVPAGALLLLSNKTRGKEERIFTCQDGTVKWW